MWILHLGSSSKASGLEMEDAGSAWSEEPGQELSFALLTLWTSQLCSGLHYDPSPVGKPK